MASKYGYHLTQKADADLDDIIGYITIELANPKAASDFLDKLQETIEETRVFPESGSLVSNEYLPVIGVGKSKKHSIQRHIAKYIGCILTPRIVCISAVKNDCDAPLQICNVYQILVPIPIQIITVSSIFRRDLIIFII